MADETKVEPWYKTRGMFTEYRPVTGFTVSAERIAREMVGPGQFELNTPKMQETLVVMAERAIKAMGFTPA
jgi:hypothetical protein